MPEKATGNQTELTMVTRYGLTAKLDNGVTVSINFNKNEVHLHFSGVDVPMKLREAEWMGTPIQLGNQATIQYTPANKD